MMVDAHDQSVDVRLSVLVKKANRQLVKSIDELRFFFKISGSPTVNLAA